MAGKADPGARGVKGREIRRGRDIAGVHETLRVRLHCAPVPVRLMRILPVLTLPPRLSRGGGASESSLAGRTDCKPLNVSS
eukprot:245101-Hanusia_phi.AAC.1